jgi:hypothetical protein
MEINQDMSLHKLLGNRAGNMYARNGLHTPRGVMERIKEIGIRSFNDAPYFTFRQEGIKTCTALGALLDKLELPWRDYIKGRYGARTEQRVRLDIDSHIRHLVRLLEEYKDIRRIEQT